MATNNGASKAPAVSGSMTTDSKGIPIIAKPPPKAPFMKAMKKTPASAIRIVAMFSSKVSSMIGEHSIAQLGMRRYQTENGCGPCLPSQTPAGHGSCERISGRPCVWRSGRSYRRILLRHQRIASTPMTHSGGRVSRTANADLDRRQFGATPCQCSFTCGSVRRVSARAAVSSPTVHRPCSATSCIL
jgi:hypothetical protein